MQSSRSATPTRLPKPCLKQLGKVCSSQQKHAHFPPPEDEARRYSALDYDRSPIVVLVNECALPARGERSLDDMDLPKIRRHHHHHHRHSSTKSASDGDEPHTGFAALETGAPIQATLMAKSGSASASVQMSSLAHHADSSDSDDGVALPIDNNGLQVYRHELSPYLDQNTSGAANSQSRRLRKSPPNRPHGRPSSRDVQLTNGADSFAWSGSNSCLGGF